MKKTVKKLRTGAVPVLLSLALIITGMYSISSIKKLQGNARVINYIGIVRGATQRLIKKELNHVKDETLMNKLDRILDGLQNGSDEFDLMKLNSPEFQELLIQMKADWGVIKDEIMMYRDGKSSDSLYVLSEAYFDLADQTVQAAEIYTEQSVSNAKWILLFMNTIFILLAILSAISAYIQENRRRKLQEAEEENRKRSEQLSKLFNEVRTPMNEISELMYISDIETYDLLFINNTGKESFHIDDIQGLKCYKALQGLDAPCPFCTIPYTKIDENYTWEKTNPITQRHYLLKDRLVEWEGRMARMEIAFDITDAENEKTEMKRRLDNDKVLLECIRELYRNHNTDTANSYVLAQMGELFHADRAYIFKLNGEFISNTNEWCNEGILPAKDNLQNLPVSDYSEWFSLFEKNDNVIVEDIDHMSDRLKEELSVLNRQDISRIILIPLDRDGVLDGFVGLDNLQPETIESATSFLQTLRYFLMLAAHRNEDEEKLSKLSYQDTLTSFFNRNRYIHDLDKLSACEGTAGIVFLDVNGLKEINDQYGHDEGDNVLKECAQTIRNNFQIGSYYRIGGDEFVIICTDISKEDFMVRVEKLKSSMSENTSCQAAIGTQWTKSCKDIKSTVTAADEHMYTDKKEFYQSHRPSGRYRHHNDSLRHLSSPTVLAKAISNHQFLVFLQPKIDVESRRVIGAEALSRYLDEDGHMVSPDKFIPILEEADIIDQLDFYTFEFICSQIKEWKKQKKNLLPISSNFSHHTFLKQTFLEHLEMIFHKYDISKELIEIEITETSNHVDFETLKAQINRVKAAGYRVSMDDFGIKSSNLSLLSSRTFDILKLDKGFIKDIVSNENAKIIINVMIEICNKLNIQIVAEGVEDETQLALLKECGIKVIQGFLFSCPVPVAEYEKKYL